jgi:hypothetical protein
MILFLSNLMIRSIVGDVQQNLAKDYFAKIIPQKNCFHYLG